jgi:type I restriction enzyme S subunit
MANKTKDSNFPIEERLEQALIPNWDEPYKLPENWCWVKLSTVCSLENGEKSTEKGLVYLDAKTLRGVTEPQTRDSGIVVNKDQKVILVDGENSGEVFVVPYRGYMGSTFKILNIVTNADEMYIRYFIDQNRDRLRNSKVGSAIPHLNKDLFFDLKLPFPPLNEQKRIVAQIESLFAKLDEAQEKAQEVVDGFETRKAAILHKAFSGELSSTWRKKHHLSYDNWKEAKLGTLLREIKYGTSEKSDYSYTGMPVLRIPNIGDMELIFDDLKFLRQNDCMPNEYLEENDILIIRSNGSKDLVGKCALVKDLDQKYTYASFLIRLRVQDSVSASYIVWYLNSENARKQLFRKAKSSAGIHNINSKEIADIDITIPHIAEQNEIVDILSALIEKEKHVKETAEAVIEQIDTIKKAILARAFRGELGTNDPSEESALELLKRVLESK